MKSLLVVIAMLSLTTLSYSQVLLKGRISDNQTGEPLPGANVRFTGTTIGTTSNDKGEFELSTDDDLSTVTISFIGYETQRITIPHQVKYLNISLLSTNLNLSEITVIGFDNNRKLIETSGAISILTPKEIQRSTNVSLGQALNIIPGVRMEENGVGGTSRVSIRGSLLRSPWGIRNIKMYWNDIPLTDPSGTSARFNAIDVNSIGSVEVIKGPSGSIYGAGTGGVINITSSRAQYGERSFELSNTFGSYGLRRTVASIRTGTETSNILVSYLDQNMDGYRDHQSVDKKAFNLAATFSPDEHRTISLNAFHYDGNFDLPGALTRAEFDEHPRQAVAFSVANDCRVSSKSTGLALSQRYQFSDRFENITSASLIFNALDHPWGSSAFYNGYTIATSQGISGRTRFVYSPVIGSVETRITAGVELQTSYELEKEYVNALGETGNLQADYEFNATQSIWFAQAEFNLPSALIATAGISYNTTQYDYINRLAANPRLKMDFDPALAPRVGLVKKLNEHTSVHGSVSYGFSPPTQWEVQTQAGVNPDLRPESGVNYEAGFRGSLLKQRLNADITAYHFSLKDAILPRYNEGQQEYFVNTGTTRQDGVEALISFLVVNDPSQLVSLLKPWVSYTFNDYKFDDYRKESFEAGEVVVYNYSGNRITGIAPNILNAGVDMDTRFGSYVMITFNYVDETPLDDENSRFVDAYALLGGKIGYRKDVGKHFTLDAFAGIDNAFGARYNNFLALNAFDGRYYNPGAGTNYFGGISLKYDLN